MAEARAARDYDKVQELQAEEAHFAWMEAEENRHVLTQHLLAKARKLDLLTPGEGFWERSSQLGYWNLTDAGAEKLREDIRKEQRWLHERRNAWLMWISALTGLFGAAAALFAVLN